jgi:PAS domain S-box-containing protein
MTTIDTVDPVDPTVELRELRTRLAEAEETLRAMRSGEVDAVVVEGPGGPQVYTLKTAADPYRLLVEQMAQAALTVSPDGLILFCNGCLAQLLDRPRERLIGTRLQDHAAPGGAGRLDDLLATPHEPGREIALRTRDGRTIELYASSATVPSGGEEVRCLVITDLSQHELRLRHAAVVEASRDIIYTLDDRLVIQTWNRGAEALTGFTAAQAIGRSEWELCPPNQRADLEHMVRQVRRQGTAASMDTVRRRRNGARLDLIYSLTPLKDRDGRLTGYSVVAHDITERKETEQRLLFLTAEIDHRARNLLATVQAIAELSARGAFSLQDFLIPFRARIQALAATHDLLSRRGWGGAPMGDVAAATLAGFGGDDRIRIDGCAATLKPRAAQDLALALHELGTNAVKYGALSVPQGRVTLDWRLEGDRLTVDWRELGGPPVTPPGHRGLGTRVIRQTAGPDGEVDYAFPSEGVRCRFTLPAACLRCQPHPAPALEPARPGAAAV